MSIYGLPGLLGGFYVETTDGSFGTPAAGFFTDAAGVPPSPPTPSAQLPTGLRLALADEEGLTWTAPAVRRFAPPAVVVRPLAYPAGRWRGQDFSDPPFRAPSRRRFAPVFAVVTADEGGISILW